MPKPARMKSPGLARGSSNRPGPSAPALPEAPPRLLLVAWCAMAALVLFGYALALRRGFSNDDYLILRQVVLHPARIEWAWTSLISGYWRPWSRELHFWILHQLFGLDATAFHAVNLTLWMGALALLLRWAQGVTHARVAVLLVAGAFAASTWGVYVVWASCSQDLWMLLFGTLFLWSQHRGRHGLAALALALALLSKETAVLLFAIGAWTSFVQRGREGLRPRDWWAPALVVASWALLHPSIGGRVLLGSGSAFEPVPVEELSVARLRFAFAPVNLEHWPHPEQGWPRALIEGAVWAAALGALAWHALRQVPAPGVSFAQRRQWMMLGLGWWALAWAPLTLHTVQWHSYYGWFGICGAWLAIVAGMLPYPRLLVALIAIVALLRPAAVHTSTSDWGTELDQAVAAARTQRIRDQLLAFHPTLPSGSRIVIAGVPSRAGLLTAPRRSAAAEVWYGDTTVTMVGLSQYWRRGPGEASGVDHFYVLDHDLKLYPLATGILPVPDSMRTLPEWAGAEEKVGAMLAQAGEWERAREIFARLVVTYPQQAREAFNLGLIYDKLGDTNRALDWLDRADSLVGAPPSGGSGFQRFTTGSTPRSP